MVTLVGSIYTISLDKKVSRGGCKATKQEIMETKDRYVHEAIFTKCFLFEEIYPC